MLKNVDIQRQTKLYGPFNFFEDLILLFYCGSPRFCELSNLAVFYFSRTIWPFLIIVLIQFSSIVEKIQKIKYFMRVNHPLFFRLWLAQITNILTLPTQVEVQSGWRCYFLFRFFQCTSRRKCMCVCSRSMKTQSIDQCQCVHFIINNKRSTRADCIQYKYTRGCLARAAETSARGWLFNKRCGEISRPLGTLRFYSLSLIHWRREFN